MSRFPRLKEMTVESGLAWCLSAFAFFEEACRSGDRDQLHAAGIIGYGMHNVPGVIQQLHEGNNALLCIYGDMTSSSDSPQVSSITRAFFAQDVPEVTILHNNIMPQSLVNAMYSTMQVFRTGFWSGCAFATDEGWEERRQTALQIVVLMQDHLHRWLAGEEFDAEACQKAGD